MDLEKFFDNDNLARTLGVKLEDATAGYAKASVEISKSVLNSLSLTHGGFIFSLCDVVLSIASNSHGTQAVAINVNINFFKATTAGNLVAEAKEISRNHKLATYNISVNDESGELIAEATGTVYRKKTPIEL